MTTDSRRSVVCIGEAPLAQLHDLGAAWDLTIADHPPTANYASDPELRAVILFNLARHRAQLREHVSRYLRVAERGVLLAVANASPKDNEDCWRFWAETVHASSCFNYEAVEKLGVLTTQPLAVIKAVLRHDAGVAPNLQLAMDGLDCLNARPETKDEATVLLRRAFHEFSHVHLERTKGGRSGTAQVYRVVATNDARRARAQFIAKIGNRISLKTEFDAFCGFARNRLAFHCVPTPVLGTPINGWSQSVIVFPFVADGDLLEEFLVSGGDVSGKASMLFKNALQPWRGAPTRTQKALGQVLVEEGDRASVSAAIDERLGRPRHCVLPKRTELDRAYRIASAKDATVPSPDALLQELASLPTIEFSECVGHGDLNSRNVFVRECGEIALIDFSHAGEMPAARDVSRLDVDVLFNVMGSAQTAVSIDQLRELYASRLLAKQPSTHEGDGRVVFVRELREYAADSGISNDEYEIMTACHLLRWSRAVRDDGDSCRMATAYHLAAALIRELRGRLSSGASA